MQVQAHTIDTLLENNSIYMDYNISREKLSKMLNCSRAYIQKLAKIAFILPDYKKECPQMSNGGLDTTRPLTPYQVWAISRVRNLMAYYCNAEMTKQCIRNNRPLFSKERFDQIMTVFNEVKPQSA